MKLFKRLAKKMGVLTSGLTAAAVTSSPAAAQGLSKAKGAFETIESEIMIIIPVVAAIALILAGIGYATKFLEKDTFIRWAVGIIIIGSVSEVIALFF